jgi:hypothetical protein
LTVQPRVVAGAAAALAIRVSSSARAKTPRRRHDRTGCPRRTPDAAHINDEDIEDGTQRAVHNR